MAKQLLSLRSPVGIVMLVLGGLAVAVSFWAGYSAGEAGRPDPQDPAELLDAIKDLDTEALRSVVQGLEAEVMADWDRAKRETEREIDQLFGEGAPEP